MAEPTLRYLKVDYQSAKDAFLQRVRARYPNTWNDFLANSFGIVFTDMVAWSTATLAFLINRAASENFIPTMTLRESAVRLGNLVGYSLHSPIPSTVLCEAVLTSPASAEVTIQAGTQIRGSDENALPFEVSKDYTIEAGELAPRELVLILSPELAGSQVVNSFVSVTNGSANADLVDSTINLSPFIQAGQSFHQKDDDTGYVIQSLENAPEAEANFSRIVLTAPWAGDTGVIAAEIFEQRIQLVQGQTVTDRFVVPAGDNPDFVVKLTRLPIIDNSVNVSVNSLPWTAVTPTAARGALAEVFTVQTFVSGATVVRFGDNILGAQVPSEAAIEITYRIGGGANGNIALNTINTSVTGLITSLSNPVPVTITNATAEGIGGRDSESLEEARSNIPFFTRTNDRAVTLDDYQTLAQQFAHPEFGSVAFARAAIRTENSFLEGNNVIIYAWTTGSSGGLVPLSSALKLALKDYLQTKALCTDLVQIYDGTARPLPISVRFKTFRGFTVSETRRLVNDLLSNRINALRPGQTVIFSDLVRALDEVQGVDNLNIATPVADLNAANSTELFTVPQDTFAYPVSRISAGSPVTDATGASVSRSTAALPIFPLAAWSLRLFLGVNELTVVPYSTPGFARVFGDNLSTDDAYASTVNLLTGKTELWLRGAPGDFSMKLNSVQGYSQDRSINLYIGYMGDNSLTKRREIRSAVRAWSEGLAVGATIYGTRVTGIFASKVSVADVVASIPGVESVTRVALDNPASAADRISSADYELLRCRDVVLNSNLD